MSMIEEMLEITAEHEKNVFGQFDLYAKKIERSLHVTLIVRDEQVKIIGEAKRVSQAKHVLEQLVALSKRGNEITEQNSQFPEQPLAVTIFTDDFLSSTTLRVSLLGNGIESKSSARHLILLSIILLSFM